MNDITDLRIFLASLLRPIINEAVNESLQGIKLSPQPEPVEEQSDFIKIAEVEKETGYKKGYVYQLVAENKIPFHKVGSSLRFSRTELRNWIKAGRPAILQQAVENLAANYILNRK